MDLGALHDLLAPLLGTSTERAELVGLLPEDAKVLQH